MRVLASLVATALLAAACGGTAAAPSPTVAPTVAPTTAPTTKPTAAPAPTPQLKYTFNADLKSSNEVPAIADAEASCAGKGVFTLNTTKDTTGAITAATAQFDLTITGCPTTTMIVLFHVHKQVAGQNGGVVVDSGQKSTDAIALTTGGTAGTVTKTNITVKPEDAKAIIDGPTGYYFNVHSTVHGGGVIRGQLAAG